MIKNYIDNSDLIPAFKPDCETELDKNTTPDWVSGLIMTAINPHNASKEGTLDKMLPFLDHMAEMGVNGLWLNPIYDRGRGNDGELLGNGYGNLGLHTIDPSLTGTDDYAEGRRVLKNFINEAHKRNIRIFLDVISWGAIKEAPIFAENPDWTTGDEEWGGLLFNWENAEFKEWYIEQAVKLVLETDCDGLRYDLEPKHAGYEVDGEIKRRLAGFGKKIFAIGEAQNERNTVYDTEQFSVTGPNGEINRDLFDFLETNPFLNVYDLTDCVKSGSHIGSYASQEEGKGSYFRYYTNMLSSHDSIRYTVGMNLPAIAYQAIFSPFIPLWYAGDECGEQKAPSECVLFDHPVEWQSNIEKPENRAFYESVKAMIRVRRSYPEIFEYFPEHFYDANICRVDTENDCKPRAYARYKENKAVLVIPNCSRENTETAFYIPFKGAGLDGFTNYTVTDAVSGEAVANGSVSDNSAHKINVPAENLRVLLVVCE